MRINPLVLLAEPDAPVTLLAPTGGARRRNLHVRLAAQVFFRRNQAEHFLIPAGLSHEEIQELRPFIPPVPEQFCVVRANDNGRPAQDAGQSQNLCFALLQKFLRMVRCGLKGCGAFIDFFVR